MIMSAETRISKHNEDIFGEYIHLIKVNIPATNEAYIDGSGEGCWARVNDAGEEAYRTDADEGTFPAILDNDSVYYPKLTHGTEILVEMRGTNKPVVPYYWLETNCK